MGDPALKSRAGAMFDHDTQKRASAHVLMIPYPAQPHIRPMLDLAYKLTSCGDIKVTFVSFKVLIDRLLLKAEISSSNDAVHFVGIPDDLPGFNPPSELPTNPVVLVGTLTLRHNLEPFLKRLLQDRESPGHEGPTCLLSDIIHWWTIDVASGLGIPRYVLMANPACFALSLLSAGEKGFTDEELSNGIHIPGLPPLTSNELPLCLRNYPAFAKLSRTRWPKSLRENDGIVLNTCLAVEASVVDTLRSMLPNKPILPVGPLGLSPTQFSKNVSMEGLQLSDTAEVSSWLDQQPPLSVLYVSFGTTGMLNLTKRHVMELARGLEASQQRFLWALRAPSDVQDGADFLPLGFEQRTKGRGLLLRGWAPQLQILEHPSTGAFLSSCGWNSALESLRFGVPIIGWPSYADQPLICRYLQAVAKVVIELPKQSDDFVEAEHIKNAVLAVLQSEEGRAVRERTAKYKTAITAAMASGGTSSRALQEYADLLTHRSAESQKLFFP